jgi:Holliday junction resolvase YEN1
LEGIGPVISLALAKGGYGDELAEAIRTLPRRDLAPWLDNYRERIRYELRHNPNKILERKAGAKADKIGPSWPKMETAMRYYNPVISSTKDYKDWEKEHTWKGKVDIGKIVQIMDEYFEYLHKEILQT